MRVAEAVGRVLAGLGADRAFGLVGSGNFHVTNALTAAGVRFVAARHEGGAAVMADAYARLSGRLGVLTVHQGPGLTNAMTGITEAAKSRTPMVVLAADTGAAGARSNFALDQAGLAAAVGAGYARLSTVDSAVDDAIRAVRRARAERRTVVLSLPLDVQAGEATVPPSVVLPDEPLVAPAPAAVGQLADLLAGAQCPVFIAGRGARAAGPALADLAERCGALLATSAVAKGLFSGPWYLDVAGGFAAPLAAELIRGADVIVAWGCTLSMWTTRHGRLIAPGATVAQVDVEPAALGANRRIDLGVVGDVAATARAVLAVVPPSRGYRTGPPPHGPRWRDVPFSDETGLGRIDPRTLSIALDDLLPVDRVVAVDSGNFMGYPSMYLSVPDEHGFCFTQAFQSIGLGLATAIGAALARPDRVPVAALGDGGFLMGVAELDTLVRLALPMVVVVYDDAAYGAEVHHFGPDGYPLDTVTFPDTDLAAIGRGFGCDGVTVRTLGDLDLLRAWLDGDRARPLVVDAKVVGTRGAWWLEEAFRGH